jgi:hypothetical protein
MICPVSSSTQTATLGCHILWTTKIHVLEGIWFVCEEQVHDDNPQQSDWFSQWGKFPRRNSWFSGYVFSAEECCGKVRHFGEIRCSWRLSGVVSECSVVCSRPVQNLSILLLMFWFSLYLHNFIFLHLKVQCCGVHDLLVCVLWTVL